MKTKQLQLIFLILGISFVVFVFSYKFYQEFQTGLSQGLNLAGAWSWNKESTSEKLPISLPDRAASFLKPYKEEYTGWLTFEKEIHVPPICKAPNKGCSFVCAEVGDTLQLSVNGYVVGTHGGLPPNYVYRKNHPVNIFIPSQIIDSPSGKAVLKITTYSPKLAQTGIRSAPFGIYNEHTAEALSLGLTLRNIILPLVVSGIMLFIAGVIALLALKTQNNTPELWSFFYYCIVTSIYLFSFSEVPREFADLSSMGFFHYFMRVLFDWTGFYLTVNFFKFPTRLTKFFHWTYAIVLLSFPAFFLGDKLFQYSISGFNGFDSAYMIMRWSFLLVLLPYAIGCVAPFKTASHKNRSILFTYWLIFPLNAYDVLIFHNKVQGSYNLKFFPVFIGISFGWFFLKKSLEERVELLAAKNEKELINQIAHDIRSPLAALRTLSKVSRNLAEAEKNLLTKCTERISEIANYLLLRASNDLDSSRFKIICLEEMVNEIINEKRMELQSSSKKIDLQMIGSTLDGLVKVNPTSFKRAFSNFLNNSVEAIPESGEIKVRVERKNKDISLSIEDNGLGIPSEIISRLGKENFSHGKTHGFGRGFKYSKDTMESFGAKVSVLSKERAGTQIEILLPAEKSIS
jgi:signal transduction histidine kinase